jgi:transposase-like protein
MSKSNYTKDFKEMAIKLSETTDKTLSQTARELDVPEGTLRHWKKESGSKEIKKDPDEIKVLKKRVAELELQN